MFAPGVGVCEGERRLVLLAAVNPAAILKPSKYDEIPRDPTKRGSDEEDPGTWDEK